MWLLGPKKVAFNVCCTVSVQDINITLHDQAGYYTNSTHRKSQERISSYRLTFKYYNFSSLGNNVSRNHSYHHICNVKKNRLRYKQQRIKILIEASIGAKLSLFQPRCSAWQPVSFGLSRMFVQPPIATNKSRVSFENEGDDFQVDFKLT